MQDELWYGTKRYKDKRVKKRVTPAPPSFTEREPGADVVQDIIDAADHLRHAHPSYKKAGPLMLQGGGVRMFWAIMLDAVSKASGLSLDDLIERIRAEARLSRAHSDSELGGDHNEQSVANPAAEPKE